MARSEHRETSIRSCIGELIHAGVAGSELAWISGAAHTLVMEKSEEFNQILIQFLVLQSAPCSRAEAE